MTILKSVGMPIAKMIGLYFPLEIGKRTLVRYYIKKTLAHAPVSSHVVRRDGLTFDLDLSEEIDLWIYLTGWWEKTDCQIAYSSLKLGDTVLDVGANVGTFALRAARAVGRSGRVFAFEPNPKSFVRLTTNARLNALENLAAVDIAAGEQPGEAELFLPQPGQAGGASFCRDWLRLSGIAPERDTGAEVGRIGTTEHATPSEATSLSISVIPIDTFCRERNVDRVDLLKVDVEGYEMAVLAGARDTIAKDRPRLMVECNELALAAGGWDIAEFLTFIWDLGYLTFKRRRWTHRLFPVTSATNIDEEVCNLHCIPKAKGSG